MKSIVGNLIDNMDKCSDWDNPLYSNMPHSSSLRMTLRPASSAHGGQRDEE